MKIRDGGMLGDGCSGFCLLVWVVLCCICFFLRLWLTPIICYDVVVLWTREIVSIGSKTQFHIGNWVLRYVG